MELWKYGLWAQPMFQLIFRGKEKNKSSVGFEPGTFRCTVRCSTTAAGTMPSARWEKLSNFRRTKAAETGRSLIWTVMAVWRNSFVHRNKLLTCVHSYSLFPLGSDSTKLQQHGVGWKLYFNPPINSSKDFLNICTEEKPGIYAVKDFILKAEYYLKVFLANHVN